ncbi:MAG: class I SAM-dependent RNA methyltransferase [Anaerolineaceae bacterium]|nr:class I SAM-dependent RNA methyltransferase [Anaerolineaceae bacterium]
MADQLFEVELTEMAHGGRALGRRGKQVVFIPYTIPGERVLARITEDRGRVVFAAGVTLLEASADRVFPRCSHFGPGRCGGCHWQHIDYAAQLLLKQDVLADQLGRIGGLDDVDVRPVIPSPAQWHYNYHMTFSAMEDGDLGLPGTLPGQFVTIDECHVAHADLLALKESLDLEAFSGLQELTLQAGGDGQLMIVLKMKDDAAPELLADMPASANLLLDGNEPANLFGDTHSRYTVNGRSFRVTAGSYFRPNVGQAGNLVKVILELLHPLPEDQILDLYGGVGLGAAFVAQQVRLVTLVEQYPPAATDAEENLADLDNVDIIEGAVEDVLDSLSETYDAVLVDPPPSGMSPAAFDALLGLNIPRLIYVSSDPATLARDAKRLVQAGYTPGRVQPLDFAPQTYYIDSVMAFERTASR